MSRRSLVLAIVVGVLSVGLATGAEASESCGWSASECLALDHYATDTLTSTDRQVIMANPELAGSLVNPDEVSGSVEADQEFTLASAGVWCRSVWGVAKHYSYFGNLMYRFHHRVHVCWNGSRVVSRDNRRTYWSGLVSTVNTITLNNGGEIDRRLPADRYVTDRQGHIENCVVKTSFCGQMYPRVHIVVGPRGSVGGWIEND